VADVFVSYSRRDQGFVRELHAFLLADGRDVWVDWEDIPPASNWEQDIEENLDSADSVVFVVSTASLASEYCRLELEHAQKRGKRIVPLAVDGADPGAAPLGLRQLNWVWCRDGDDRDASFAQVAQALETDLEWARAHTRLLVRAVEWDGRGRTSSLLLRGRPLEEAIAQLAQHHDAQPKPTDLQQEYVQASRRGAKRRQRTLLGSVSFALAVAIALAVLALLQRNTANERARIARSQALAAQAEQSLAAAPADGLRDALGAMRTHRTDEARAALRDALRANPILSVVPAPKTAPSRVARPDALAYGDEGRVLVGLTPDSRLHVWGVDGDEKAPARRATRATVSPNGGRVLSVDGRAVRVERLGQPGSVIARRLRPGEHAAATGFAEAKPLVLAVGRSGGARIVDIRTGRSVALERPHLPIGDGAWSADGSTVVTVGAAQDGDQARVWDARTGRLRATLPSGGAASAAINRHGTGVATFGGVRATLWSITGGRPQPHALGYDVGNVAFGPKGSVIATVGPTGTATLWRLADGRPLGTFPGFGSFHSQPTMTTATPFVPALAFNPDGRQLAVAAADGRVRVFDRASGKAVATIAAGWVNALAFARGGGRLAAMSWDGGVVVALTPGTRLASGVEYCTWAPVVSPDGGVVASATGEGSVALSGVGGRLLAVLRPPIKGAASPAAPAFSEDGSTVAVSTAKCVNLASLGERFGTGVWRVGTPAPVLQLPAAHGSSVLLDRRGSVLVLDGVARRVRSGTRLPRLDGVAAFTSDGRRALRLRRGTLQVVRVPSGAPLVTFTGGVPRDATARDVVASFSSDGNRLVASWSEGPADLWDAAAGTRIARLGTGPSAPAFADRGRHIVAVFDHLIRTYRSDDGSVVSTLPAAVDGPSAIAPSGMFVAVAEDEGRIDVIDVATGLRTHLQTASTAKLGSVAFVPGHDLFSVYDATGGAYLVPCGVCAADEALMGRASATLARASRVPRGAPPVAATIP
jgi:WD40 repeat protein